MRGRLALGALAGIVLGAADAGAQPTSYRPPIDWLNVTVVVEEDARLTVTETAGLKTWEWHRVTVNVPPTYQPAGSDFLLHRHTVEAFDDRGAPLRLGVYQTPRGSPEPPRMTVFAGRDDMGPRRPVRVTVRYGVQQGVFRDAGLDRLSWTVVDTGSAGFPIRSAELTVALPPAVPLDGVRFSVRTHRTAGDRPAYESERRGHTLTLRTTRPLWAGDAFAVDLVWRPGAIRIPVPAPPSKTKWLIEHPEWALPLLALAGGLVLRARSMRNPGRSLSIKPEYEPPRGLRPGEMGTLIDGTVDTRDVVATLVDLACRGYVRVHRILDNPLLGSDYSVTLLKSWRDARELKPFEQMLLAAVFVPTGPRFTEVGPFRLENAGEDGSRLRLARTPLSLPQAEPEQGPRFFSDFVRDGAARDLVRLQIYRDLADQRFLAASPHQVRWPWRAAGVGLAAASWIATALDLSGASTWLAGSIAGIVVILLAPAKPRLTYRGAAARTQILGFREVLQRAEQDRLAQLPAETLDTWLPYAIALGVESGWMAGFQSLSLVPPAWYQASTPFDRRRFAEELAVLSRKP